MPTEAVETTSYLAREWPIVAIVVIVFVICGWFALRVFKEYRAWQTSESALNRAVQKEREDSWQTFIATQGELNRQSARDMTAAITELQKRIDVGFSGVNETLAAHDARVELRVSQASGGIRGKSQR
jgi:hypothetical protein